MAKPQPQPSSYPARTRRTLAITSWVLLGFLLLSLGMIGLHIMQTVDCMVDIFADMGEKLPELTSAMLAPGQTGWWAILGAVAVALVLKEVLVREPLVRLAVNLVAGFVAFAVYHLYQYALFLPMVRMLEGMQK